MSANDEFYTEQAEYVSSRYDRTAWFYERAAHIYSAGQILESKRWQLRNVQASDKLLFVGAGSGEDVVLAAQKGAEITVVELAPKMLQRIAGKLDKLGLRSRVTLICGDAFKHQKKGYYDLVMANYFLNVFPYPAMVKMLKHLSYLLKGEGRLMVADFAPINGNLAQRVFQRVYYYSALLSFHLIAKNPIHSIYDYSLISEQVGLKVNFSQVFKVLRGQSSWYRSLELVKDAASN